MESYRAYTIMVVVILLFFGGWLWVLTRRRDLWLRYLAAEARLYSNLHMPSGFTAASGRFQEGRGPIYLAVTGLVVSILVLALIALVWFRANRTPHGREAGGTASTPRGLYIRVDTNGLPTILGVPLGTGSGRDITLQSLRQTHVPVTVLMPSGGGHSLAWDTNSGATLKAIIKAGLIPTNKPSGPSPYE